jgi:hypothetical protein
MNCGTLSLSLHPILPSHTYSVAIYTSFLHFSLSLSTPPSPLCLCFPPFIIDYTHVRARTTTPEIWRFWVIYIYIDIDLK